MKERRINRLSRRKVLMPAIFAAAGLLMLLIVSIAWAGDRGKPEQDLPRQPAALTVEGEAISPEELALHAEWNRSKVAEEYRRRFAAEADEGFWTRKYGGETPAERLHAVAAEQAVRMKLVQLAAKEAGVVSAIDYGAFRTAMERENERRAEAIANHEVIYGPSKLDEQAFYSYYMSGLQQATIEAMLAGGSLTAAEQALQEAYEAQKESRFRLQGEVVVKQASLSAAEKDAAQKLNSLREQGLSAEQFTAQAERLGAKVGELRFSPGARSPVISAQPAALQTSMELRQGETSGVLEENGTLYLIYCVSAEPSVYLPFAEVKPMLVRELAEQQYMERLEERFARACKNKAELKT